jgi:hypothetical protein
MAFAGGERGCVNCAPRTVSVHRDYGGGGYGGGGHGGGCHGCMPQKPSMGCNHCGGGGGKGGKGGGNNNQQQNQNQNQEQNQSQNQSQSQNSTNTNNNTNNNNSTNNNNNNNSNSNTVNIGVTVNANSDSNSNSDSRSASESQTAQDMFFMRQGSRDVVAGEFGNGGGSAYFISDGVHTSFGALDVVVLEKKVAKRPKPVKGLCSDIKGLTEAAILTAPSTNLYGDHDVEVFRCRPGESVSAIIGTLVDYNGYDVANYDNGRVIRCVEGEALRFGQGQLMCVRAAPYRGPMPSYGGTAEVLLHHDAVRPDRSDYRPGRDNMTVSGWVNGAGQGY